MITLIVSVIRPMQRSLDSGSTTHHDEGPSANVELEPENEVIMKAKKSRVSSEV